MADTAVATPLGIQLLDFANDIDIIAPTPTALTGLLIFRGPQDGTENQKMEHGEEDQIQSSINHIKNLTLLTSSKYNELNGQVTLSE
ncbi:hypothetical protein TNCV_2578471 [Trichonephila clavipes]|nr:hypothetical protein TNCV_2578471 [Trichonephila clavipes]